MKAAKIFAKNEAQTNKKTHTHSTARCSARGIKTKLKCCQLHEILQFDLRCMQRRRLRICLSCPFQCEATSEMLIELAKSTTSQLHWLLHFAPLTTLPSLLHVCFDLHDLRSLCKLEREHIPVRPDSNLTPNKTLVYIFSIKLCLPAINS